MCYTNVNKAEVAIKANSQQSENTSKINTHPNMQSNLNEIFR